MNSAEVVVHHVKRDGRDVVFDLLGECIGKRSKSAHGHPHGEVLTFDIA